MINIFDLLMCLSLSSNFDHTNQLAKIIKGIYSISTGGVTQKNISRQTSEEGYGYRSVQRFFALDINWEVLYLSCISYFFLGASDTTYIMAIDEVVVSKSGKQTHGVSRFFSSIVGRPIPAVCYHVLSLLEVNSRKSFVVKVEQRFSEPKPKTEEKTLTKTSTVKKKKPGRPKGSKNKTHQKSYTGLSKSFERLLQAALLLLTGIGIVPSYIVADSAYSSKTYVLICLEQHISLISKLRCTSVLYLPYEETSSQRKRGRKRKYGKRIDIHQLDKKSKFYIETLPTEEDSNLLVEMYHFPKIWTKFLPVLINVVVLKAIHQKTGKTSHRILFSTDLTISAAFIVEYYCLRFQIEFNFRDAKQYFGLADFRAYKKRQVDNSVGLAFFMVNFSPIIRKKVMQKWEMEQLSILDLKALYRTEKYVQRVLKSLDLDPKLIKNQIDIRQLATLEAVNLN